MQRLLSCVLLATAAVAGTAEAGELNLTIANGRVTLIAHDVTVRQILDEWAKVGQTRIVNGDKLLGAPLTIDADAFKTADGNLEASLRMICEAVHAQEVRR